MAENQLVAEMDRPGIGHNRPPLAELIGDLGPMVVDGVQDTLARYWPRQAEALEVAQSAVIMDSESAAKVVDLMQQMRAIEQELEQEHDRLKRPFLDACRTIDRAFSEIRRPLEVTRHGEGARGGLRGMLTEYERQRQAEAQLERERYEAEVRRLEAAAEAARRAAEDGSVRNELEALQAAEAAAAAERRAAAIRPEPIRSHLGSVGLRREIVFGVNDLTAAVRWMAGKQNPLRSQLEQAVRTILGKHLRGLGVDAIDAGVNIPGVNTAVATQAQVRR
jgi:hypothetical protein